MRVLVTGQDGYIGAVLAPFLEDRGHEVVGLDCGLFSGRAFGDDSRLANEILLVFCDAFGFPMDERYKFTPDDRIMDVYIALYPPRWSMSDSLELETLVTSLQERFRLRVSRFDSGETVSFREVVSAVKKAQQAVCSEPRDGASISCRKSGSRGR